MEVSAYLLLVIRGLEHLAIAEIHEKVQVETVMILTLENDPKHPKLDVERGEAAVGKILLHTTSSPKEIKTLCSIQAFLAYLGHSMELPTNDQSGLEHIGKLVEESHLWASALNLWQKHRVDAPSSIRFRASCVRDGKHSYSSEKIAGEVGAAVLLVQKWTVSLAEYDLEVVCLVMHHQVLCGISLAENPRVINFRGGRLAPETRRIPSLQYISTLRPSTAYLMLQLAKCSEGDIVLDCMCGVGTLPACSALWAPVYGIGGDICEDAVNQANVNFHGQRASVCRWSSDRLPLRSSSVDRILVDMPFGLRCGNPVKNSRLYPKATQEMARVLRLGGRAVLLVMSKKLMAHSIRSVPSLKVVETIAVNIGGLGVAIFVVEKIESTTKRKIDDLNGAQDKEEEETQKMYDP